jgi:hypothetical protein
MKTKHWKLEHLKRLGAGLGLISGVACSASDGSESVTAVFEEVVPSPPVPASPPSPIVDARRSLAITDQPILENFGLKRVLDQLILTSGVTGLSATTLFQQWWDTQNPGPGLGLGAHCNDNVDGAYNPQLNGYPYTCRPAPAEGAEASCDPFAAGTTCAYIPIGLFMRFDLAPSDGAHCGEYRIVYAKAAGRTESQNRNLLIFEASLPNPHVLQGIRGCQKFVRAWAELSEEANMVTRKTTLEEFYFTGYKEFAPVVSYENFGDNPNGAGQVRTNQFMQPISPRVWSLREFKLMKSTSGTPTLRFVPVSDKTNPYGPLFDGASTHANAAGFQAEFVSEVGRLAGAGIGAIGLKTTDLYNSAQSEAAGSVLETNYPANFGTGANAFGASIQTALTGLGSSLTPIDVVRRAQAMSCAGCHRFSSNVDVGGGLIWPASQGFTHVSERDIELETVGGVTRFGISSALTDHFLPARKQLVENYLNDVPLPPRAPTDPIGGRFVH